MKKVLKDLFLFCCLITALLSVLTWITDHELQRTRQGIYQPWNQIARGVNADLLVMGNSHALVQISPKVLGERLHRTVFNIGMPGYPFDMQLARYRFYRGTNKKPQMIILTVDINEFAVTDNFNDEEQFLPYLRHNCFANTPLPPYYALYRYLPFLKYQEQDKLVRTGIRRLVSKPPEDSSFYENGYHGWDKPWDPAAFKAYLKEHSRVVPKIDREVFGRFQQFIAQCHKEQIRVVLVATPYYEAFSRIMLYRDNYYQFLSATAARLDIGYYDFVKHPISLDSNNYYNANHLNRRGAEQLTFMIADSISREALK